MTIQEIHDYFDLVQDQYNAPYFITEEKDMFVNAAQLRFVDDIIFRDILGHTQTPKGQAAIYGTEDKINTSEILQPLIISDYSLQLPSSGSIAKSSIDAIANSIVSGSKVMHILNFFTSDNSNYSANKSFRWLRDNDYGRFYQNQFKSPSLSRPYVKLSYSSYKFLPKPSATGNITVSFIRTPQSVSYTNNITLELPEFTHYTIVALALDIAGVATADQILMNTSNLTK